MIRKRGYSHWILVFLAIIILALIFYGMFFWMDEGNETDIIDEQEEKVKSINEKVTNTQAGCRVDSYNCADFETCEEVMEIFGSCETDVHKLDSNNDGVPCENLCE